MLYPTELQPHMYFIIANWSPAGKINSPMHVDFGLGKFDAT